MFYRTCFSGITFYVSIIEIFSFELDEQNLKELQRIYDSNPNFDWTSSGHFILREAVLSGKLEVVRFLFENVGMEVDAEAGFALRYASKLGLTPLVDYLLNRNAVVESRNREAYRWALHMGKNNTKKVKTVTEKMNSGLKMCVKLLISFVVMLSSSLPMF